MTDPLVFLPGILCDRLLWAGQMEALSDVARGVFIALDADTIDAMADQVLLQAPPRFGLAALSMGGYVALAVVAKAPQRVTRLCLANTSGRADTEAQRAGRLKLLDLAARRGIEPIVERLTPAAVHLDRHADILLMATVADMMRGQGVDAFRRQQTAVMARPDRIPGLSAITAPTQVVGGDADRIIPPDHAVELAALIPNAELEMMENCGHISPLEQPARMTAILRRWWMRPVTQ